MLRLGIENEDTLENVSEDNIVDRIYFMFKDERLAPPKNLSVTIHGRGFIMECDDAYG